MRHKFYENSSSLQNIPDKFLTQGFKQRFLAKNIQRGYNVALLDGKSISPTVKRVGEEYMANFLDTHGMCWRFMSVTDSHPLSPT